MRIRLFGAGVPVNFDFSRLSFQVPMLGLSWPSIKAGTPRQRTATAKIRDARFIFSLLRNFPERFPWGLVRNKISIARKRTVAAAPRQASLVKCRKRACANSTMDCEILRADRYFAGL